MGCAWPKPGGDSAANTEQFPQEEGLLPLTGLELSPRVPVQTPLSLPWRPSRLPSAPSRFSLPGVVLDTFLAHLILSWHLVLEGLELIREPMEVKRDLH